MMLKTAFGGRELSHSRALEGMRPAVFRRCQPGICSVGRMHLNSCRQLLTKSINLPSLAAGINTICFPRCLRVFVRCCVLYRLDLAPCAQEQGRCAFEIVFCAHCDSRCWCGCGRCRSRTVTTSMPPKGRQSSSCRRAAGWRGQYLAQSHCAIVGCSSTLEGLLGGAPLRRLSGALGFCRPCEDIAHRILCCDD